MTRRNFIKLLGASLCVAAAPSFVTTEHKFQIFTLHGDGITDDTEAIQALFDGKEVTFGGTVLKEVDGVIRIPSGVFKIDNKIRI